MKMGAEILFMGPPWTRERLCELVARIYDACYWDEGESGLYDRDKEVNGGDLVELVCGLFEEYGVAPDHSSALELCACDMCSVPAEDGEPQHNVMQPEEAVTSEKKSIRQMLDEYQFAEEEWNRLRRHKDGESVEERADRMIAQSHAGGRMLALREEIDDAISLYLFKYDRAAIRFGNHTIFVSPDNSEYDSGPCIVICHDNLVLDGDEIDRRYMAGEEL